jgi:DNA-binding NarL/FixJ family response regulator
VNVPRVLLVEDSADFAALVVAALGAAASVGTSETLTAALASVRSDPPDVVVCDLGLPDAQGTDAVAALRAACPGVPVVVLTADPTPRTAAATLAAGAAMHLFKDAVLDGTLAQAITEVTSGPG